MLLIGQIKIQCSHIYLSYLTRQLKVQEKTLMATDEEYGYVFQ